jgi:hypothetical protein
MALMELIGSPRLAPGAFKMRVSGMPIEKSYSIERERVVAWWLRRWLCFLIAEGFQSSLAVPD